MHLIDRLHDMVGTAAAAGARARRLLWGSSLYRRAARRRLGAWSVVLLVGIGVHHVVDTARATERSWGATSPVVVVTATVAAGGSVPAAALAVERRPVRTAPVGALHRLPPPARARIDLGPGLVLTAGMLDTVRRGATASALPDGTVGVVASTGLLRPPVERGDRVDVLAGSSAVDVLVERTGEAAAGPVARGATVLRVEDDRVTLAVRPSEAAPTGGAALAGPVALVLLR